MQTFNFLIKKKARVLALGAESAGRFAFYKNGNIFVSENFGDILDGDNFKKFKKEVLKYIRKEKPDIILTDLHPIYNSTIFGQELSQKLKIPQIKIQHHIAHIFSAVGDYMLNTKYSILNTFYGIACDGTGYGLDGNIWGGEVFKIKIPNSKFQIPNKSQTFPPRRSLSSEDCGEKARCIFFSPQSRGGDCGGAEISSLKSEIKRIGSLEEQIMIGGDLAVKEPARMLIAILAKIPNPKLVLERHRGSQIPNKLQIPKSKIQKDFIYKYVKKYYSRNEFEALYSQLRQNFNCQTTTSTGRVLDAVSLLLGFADNKRTFKHEATKLLEKNSTIPYNDIESRIANQESRILNNNPMVSPSEANQPWTGSFQLPVYRPAGVSASGLQRDFNANPLSRQSPLMRDSDGAGITNYQLPTTNLFQYLLKNINKDKMRLAATAQEYIARGFYEIAKKNTLNTKYYILNTYFSGGMANNKIMSAYLEKRGIYTSKKIPRGDEGLAFGQIVYYVLKK